MKFRWERLLYAVGLLACLLTTWQPQDATSDLWANAAIGRWVARHGRVPRETLFLWTTHKPWLPTPYFWVAHHWLSDLVFYGLLNRSDAAGGVAAMGFTLLLVALCFGVLWWLWSLHGEPGLLAFFAFALAIHCSGSRFAPRPELFTAVFIALLLVPLTRWDQWNWPPAWKIASIAGLFALWANCHGAVLFGLVLIVTAAGCELAQSKGNASSRLLAACALAAIVAIFVNPYGVEYLQAFKTVHSYTFATIEEWRPLWAEPAVGKAFLLETGAIAALALASWCRNPLRRWSQFIWLIVFAYSFAEARRNAWVFCIVCLAVLAANAGSLGFICPSARDENARNERRFPGNSRRTRGALGALALAATLYCYLPAVGRGVLLAPPLSDRFPTGMAGYFETHPAPAHLFNDYNNSPYFEWRFGERLPLYIDLINAYPEKITITYDDICHCTDAGRVAFEGLHIDCVALCTPDRGDKWPPLAAFLRESPRWECAYDGPDGMIWNKRA